MLGIIGAMEIETDGLIAMMSECRINDLGGYKFVKGKLRGKDVVVCRCGIGKVFSSTAAALMLFAYEIDGIINIGVAGGMKPLKQGELVVAERTVQHDFDATADGLEKGCVPGFDSPYFNCDRAFVGQLSEVISRLGYRYKVGTIASGDMFVGSKSKSEEIFRQFGAIAFDMESAAINQVCVGMGVGFTALRAVSDNGDDAAVKSFYEFVDAASSKSIEVMSEFIASFG